MQENHGYSDQDGAQQIYLNHQGNAQGYMPQMNYMMGSNMEGGYATPMGGDMPQMMGVN